MSTEPSSAQGLQRPPSINHVEGGANPPSIEQRTAMKADEVQKHLHFHQFPAPSRPLFTGASTSALDCAADYSYVIRQFFNNLNIDSLTFTAMGMTTACNSVTGAVASVKAYDRFKAAQAIEHRSGKIESIVDMARGVSQSMGGAFYVAYRPLSITATIQGLDISSPQAATPIGRGGFITGVVGNAFFGAFYAVISGYFFYMLKRMYSFRSKFFQDKDIKKLDNVGNVQEFMKFLTEKRLGVSPENTLQKMLKAYSNSPSGVSQGKVRQELKASCMDSTKTWIKAMIKEAEKLPGSPASSISEKDCGQIAEKLLAELDNFTEHKDELIQSLGFNESMDKELLSFVKTLSFTELLGLDLKTVKREKRKEKKLAEFVGGSVVTALIKAKESGLTERLASSDPVIQAAALEEAQGILKDAQSTMRVGLFNSWCLLIAGVIGVAATIATFVFTGGIGAIVAGVLFLACALAMLFPDVIFLRSSQVAEGQPGSLDKWLLGFSTTVAIISLFAAIILGSVFSMGTVPLVLAVVIGLLWLGNNLYSLDRLIKKEERFALNNPTCQSLAMRLQVKTGAEQIDPLVMDQFKKLSKEERKAVKAEAVKLQSIDPSAERSLSESDKELDRGYNFGVEFLKAHTSDAAVLRAVEKAYEFARSDTLRGLYDRLKNISKSFVVDEAAIQEIKDFFAERLTSEQQTLVAQNIYNKRAKKASSRSFECIKLSDLKKALIAVSSAKKTDKEQARLKFVQHSITLFSGFKGTAVA